MVAPSLESLGAEATSRSFLAMWDQARARHDVTLVAGWSSSRASIPDAALGVRVPPGLGLREPVNLGSPGHLAGYIQLTRAVRSLGRPDVTLVAGLVAPGVRGPSVAWLRAAPSPPRQLAARWSMARAVRRFERVMVPSTDLLPAVLALGWPPSCVDVVPDGLDRAVFAPPARSRAADPDRLVLIVPGRVRPERGQHIAIDAVCRLPPPLKHRVALRVVGRVTDEAYHHHLRAAAIDQPITFHVDVPSMGDALRDADLALIPSLLDDASAHPAIEALACGVPVLHSDLPALVRATGGLGGPVQVDDAAAWRDAIARFIAVPGPLRSMAARGARWAPLKYGWPAVWDQVEQHLRWFNRR